MENEIRKYKISNNPGMTGLFSNLLEFEVVTLTRGQAMMFRMLGFELTDVGAG